MSLALWMATHGEKVLYVSCADMNWKDFIVRLSSIAFGIKFSEAYKNLGACYDNLKKLVGNNLEISINAAGQVSAEDIVEKVMAENFSVAAIDYDACLEGAGEVRLARRLQHRVGPGRPGDEESAEEQREPAAELGPVPGDARTRPSHPFAHAQSREHLQAHGGERTRTGPGRNRPVEAGHHRQPRYRTRVLYVPSEGREGLSGRSHPRDGDETGGDAVYR